MNPKLRRKQNLEEFRHRCKEPTVDTHKVYKNPNFTSPTNQSHGKVMIYKIDTELCTRTRIFEQEYPKT